MAEVSKSPRVAFTDAIRLLQTFQGADLTRTIHQIEESLKGVAADGCASVLETSGAKAEILDAAAVVKQLAGQINVIIQIEARL